MHVLDVIILLGMVYMALHWARAGLVHGFFALVGFFGGLLFGAWLLQFMPAFIVSPEVKLILSLVCIVFSGAVIGSLADQLGMQLSPKTEGTKLREADAILGALFSIFLAGAIVWVFSAVLSASPYASLNRAFQESRLVQAINKSFPPAPPELARIGSSLKQFEFPQVFIGPEPEPIEPLAPPDNSVLASIVRETGSSTVRIEAVGCGAVSRGSGFVAADNLVVTNAHVVAGSDSITVADSGGRRRATLIYFDPDLDIAVLKSSKLVGRPLVLAPELQARGTAGATLGYPGGGNFKASPATVSRQISARGLNIYGRRNVTRSVYELQTSVIPGNSGGPVVGTDNRVFAVVFARSQTNSGIGYALTAGSVAPAITAAVAQPYAIASGQCVTGE